MIERATSLNCRADLVFPRVLSKEWVDTVFSNGYELKGTGDGWYRKGGMHGQVLLLNPTKGIAIACHSYDKRMKAAVLLENCAFD